MTVPKTYDLYEPRIRLFEFNAVTAKPHITSMQLDHIDKFMRLWTPWAGFELFILQNSCKRKKACSVILNSVKC